MQLKHAVLKNVHSPLTGRRNNWQELKDKLPEFKWLTENGPVILKSIHITLLPRVIHSSLFL